MEGMAFLRQYNIVLSLDRSITSGLDNYTSIFKAEVNFWSG